MEPEITAALISAVVTLATGGPIYLWLNRKLERYKNDLAEATSELRGQIAVQERLAELRITEYPRLAKNISELVKGMRMASSADFTAADLSMLRIRVDQLEDSLYSAQLQLQRDGLHAEVHGFKNGALTILQLLSDRETMVRQSDISGVEVATEHLRRAASTLEAAYPHIREKLASKLDDLGLPVPE